MTRLSDLIRRNLLGMVAIFIALSGTAWGGIALPLQTTGAGSNSSPGYGSGGTFNVLRVVAVNVGPVSRPVFIVGSNEFWGPGSTCTGRIRLEWQGTQRDETLASQIAPPSVAGNNYGTVVTHAMPVLPAGTHQIRLYGAYFDGCFSQNSKLAAIVLEG